MTNDYSQTVTREIQGLVARPSGFRFPIWNSGGVSGDDSQIASIATVQSFQGVIGAGYRISAADGTSAATIASGTPENVYVRFSGTGADGTTRDWLWRASLYDLEYRCEAAADGTAQTISFVAVNGGAVKLFIRRLY